MFDMNLKLIKFERKQTNTQYYPETINYYIFVLAQKSSNQLNKIHFEWKIRWESLN